MKRAMLAGSVVVVASFCVLSGQEKAPTCRSCPSVYVPNDEIRAYVARAVANNIIDQQIRAIDVGRTNVDVGIVHRGKLAAPAARAVAEHDQVSEVYHVIDGSATLVTGPDIVDARRRPADNDAVLRLNGPGNDAASIRNGISHELHAGDVIVIPAGTGHQFTRIDDHITYLMVRIDPDKVTPLKDEAASQADLRNNPNGPGRGRGNQ
jgi:mannose-6-phosphate isomerase-like protein (cupin superfamily)